MSIENDSPSYGPYLQAVRVKRGISIEAVSARTRIQPAILRAIEAEDEAALPDPVFVKGFIRSIAETIGADPEMAVSRYPGANRPEPLKGAAERRRKPGKTPSLVTLMLALLVIFGLAALVLTIGRWRSTPEPPAAAPSGETVPLPAPPETPAAVSPAPAAAPILSAPPAPASGADPAGKGHVLRVYAFEDTWIKVIRDEEKPDEYFLKNGEELELEARSVYNLLIGNAGGVRLELDGKPVPVSGKSGQVLTLQLP